MHDQEAKSGAPKSIASAIESIMKTQSSIFELINTGEQIMDEVCPRQPEEVDPDTKELSELNLTEVLQKIERRNSRLLSNAEHLIKRMRSTF